jgi:hypothetical protein
MPSMPSLPYAPGGNVDLVSRVSAENSLRQSLDIGDDGEPRPWSVVAEAPPPVDSSTASSITFATYLSSVPRRSAAVKQIPGDWGNTAAGHYSAVGGGSCGHRCRFGHTTPDFVLE